MAAKQIKTIRTHRGVREHARLGCPLTRNRSPWCFRICDPAPDGTGECGRVAPHSLMSSTQMAIVKHKEKKQEAHYHNLEHLYLAAPYNEFHEPGIRVAAGEADIVIPVQEKLFHPAGISDTVMLKAMNDAAVFAANSLVEGHYVRTEVFNVSLNGATPKGEIIARGRFIGMSGEHYLAQVMLTDLDGDEIGRGEGTFVVSDVKLSAA